MSLTVQAGTDPNPIIVAGYYTGSFVQTDFTGCSLSSGCNAAGLVHSNNNRNGFLFACDPSSQTFYAYLNGNSAPSPKSSWSLTDSSDPSKVLFTIQGLTCRYSGGIINVTANVTIDKNISSVTLTTPVYMNDSFNDVVFTSDYCNPVTNCQVPGSGDNSVENSGGTH